MSRLSILAGLLVGAVVGALVLAGIVALAPVPGATAPLPTGSPGAIETASSSPSASVTPTAVPSASATSSVAPSGSAADLSRIGGPTIAVGVPKALPGVTVTP